MFLTLLAGSKCTLQKSTWKMKPWESWRHQKGISKLTDLYQCDGKKSICELGLEIYCFILTELQVIFFFLILLSIKYKMSCITTMILNRFWGLVVLEKHFICFRAKNCQKSPLHFGKKCQKVKHFFLSQQNLNPIG